MSGYEVDIKIAGSLSLMVSLPTMIVGFARYSRSDAFDVLRREQLLFRWVVAGMGGLMLGHMPPRLQLAALGCILRISAMKICQHSEE
jgi:hypothetical protein